MQPMRWRIALPRIATRSPPMRWAVLCCARIRTPQRCAQTKFPLSSKPRSQTVRCWPSRSASAGATSRTQSPRGTRSRSRTSRRTAAMAPPLFSRSTGLGQSGSNSTGPSSMRWTSGCSNPGSGERSASTGRRAVFLAHELYHHFDEARVRPLCARHRLPLLRLGWLRLSVAVPGMREIAAGAFAQHLLGLHFHPRLLDIAAVTLWRQPALTHSAAQA